MRSMGLLPLGVALVVVGGCAPEDQGVVMGCFGLVNEDFPGEDVVTNMFFGGCSPDDVGMQIMERATPAACSKPGRAGPEVQPRLRLAAGGVPAGRIRTPSCR